MIQRIIVNVLPPAAYNWCSISVAIIQFRNRESRGRGNLLQIPNKFTYCRNLMFFPRTCQTIQNSRQLCCIHICQHEIPWLSRTWSKIPWLSRPGIQIIKLHDFPGFPGPVRTLLQQRRLRWFGHLHRMPSSLPVRLQHNNSWLEKTKRSPKNEMGWFRQARPQFCWPQHHQCCQYGIWPRSMTDPIGRLLLADCQRSNPSKSILKFGSILITYAGEEQKLMVTKSCSYL